MTSSLLELLIAAKNYDMTDIDAAKEALATNDNIVNTDYDKESITKNRDIHKTSTDISPSHMVVEGDPQKTKKYKKNGRGY